MLPVLKAVIPETTLRDIGNPNGNKAPRSSRFATREVPYKASGSKVPKGVALTKEEEQFAADVITEKKDDEPSEKSIALICARSGRTNTPSISLPKFSVSRKAILTRRRLQHVLRRGPRSI
ncbi:MAG: hypothetical protein WCB34_00045 [Methylovirgula sp.]